MASFIWGPQNGSLHFSFPIYSKILQLKTRLSTSSRCKTCFFLPTPLFCRFFEYQEGTLKNLKEPGETQRNSQLPPVDGSFHFSGPDLKAPNNKLFTSEDPARGFSLPSVPTTAPSKPPTAPGLFASEEARALRARESELRWARGVGSFQGERTRDRSRVGSFIQGLGLELVKFFVF